MWYRVLYYSGITIGVALWAWLMGFLGKKEAEKMKTAKCLKCKDGAGHLFKIDKGKRKVSYKCDSCKSTWVEGF